MDHSPGVMVAPAQPGPVFGEQGEGEKRKWAFVELLGGKTHDVCPLKLLPNKTDYVDAGSSEVSRPGVSKV